MTETTLIALPCRVITLRVELGAESGASTLEELVLAAVAGGRNTVGELGDLFSLPHRLVLDVVHGLWGRGFLAVDFSTNVLERTQAAEAVLSEDAASRTLAATVQQRKFLFDPVTATILPYEEGAKRIPHGALDMPLARGFSEDDLPQAELLRAVRQAVDQDRRRRGVRRRVQKVSFANPVLSPPEAVRWTTVETVVKRDPGTGTVAAVPIELPVGWGRRALELFQSRITHLMHTRPDSRFVRQLTTRQAPEVIRFDSLRSLMLELEELAEGLGTVPDDQVPSRHDALRTRTNQVLEELTEARRARCSARSVSTKADVDWVVSDLIDRAEHQLVLALPYITYDALRRVLPDLELAAKRGVNLVFLWGDHQSAKLEPRVATALLDLHARFSENVLVEPRSSSCAASLVICDDRSAYVGSRSVLSGDSGCGVLVEPAAGTDTPPECVADLLSWTRRVYPYWETARRIFLAPADFGRREHSVDDIGPDVWRRRFEPPELAEDWNDDAVAHHTRWAAGWGRLLQGLGAAVNKVYTGDPVVRAVWDGRYVDLVQHLIVGADDRLALTDDRAEPEACGEQLARQLTELRDRGAVVHLQHPPLADGRRTDRTYAELLQRLGGDRTLRTSEARARAVLSDHEAVVGSHRPLGNRAVNPVRGPAPAELGLHIVGTAFVAGFAGALGIPDWYGSATELPAYLPPLPTVAAAPVRDDPWMVLAGRRDSGDSAEVLRRESAALLLGTTDGGADREEWERWLLNDAWERGAFMEAYVLAPLLSSAERATRDLAAVAVPLEHGPLGYPLYASAIELGEAPPEHRTVALAGAVAEMLMHGGSVGRDVCEALAEPDGLGRGLPAAWVRLANAASTCFAGLQAPLPLQDVIEWAAHHERSAEFRERWLRLAADLDEFELAKHRFNFQDGEKLHRALFQPEGMLAGAREMALHDAAAGPRANNVATLPRNEQEVRTQMDKMAGKLKLRKIEWRHHMVYARKVADLLTEARTLAAQDGGGTNAPALLPVLNPFQREFARHLDRDWLQLLAEAEALGEPARRPAKALLEALSALPKAGREEV
ncbi:hypothetical protein ACLQ2D_22110 [Streptomyces sp. DT199]|uniref:hypothetical protein n=1 Tax=Streptomyces TaxID=1883 RepID=UPI0033A93AA7